MNRFRPLSLLVLLLMTVSSYAENEGVRLLTSPRKDKILLRWAPSSPEVWRLGNTYGYIVERHTLLRKSKLLKQKESAVLSDYPMKPTVLEEWKAFAEDRYVSIAAGCIFGESPNSGSAASNPTLAYEQVKEERQRYSFALYAADQSLQVAQFSGLYLEDAEAKADEKYLYKVYINAPDSMAVDTAFSFTGIAEYQPLPKPLDLKAEWGDKSVELSWNTFYHKHIYNSYFVEKSTDGGAHYERVSDNAKVQLTNKKTSPKLMYSNDSLENNDLEYYYRVRGINAFGEVSPPSDSIFGMGILPITNAPIVTDHQVINNEHIKLDWEYPSEMNDYITGFKIYNSPKPKGRKKLIYCGEAPEARSFVDENAYFTNYYKIAVYSEQESKLSPLMVYAARIDSFPPEPPVIATSTIDSTGIVSLQWHANTEIDMDGYRVYRANDPKFEFSLVTPAVLEDTLFAETINIKTLNKYIYYKVRAIDVRGNQSALSALITVKRPDIIPPVSPVIKDIKEVKENAEILWVNSSSKDVVKHLLYRREMDSDEAVLVTTLPYEGEKKTLYVDKKVEIGKAYSYYVVAEDDSELKSLASNQGYYKSKTKIKEKLKLKRRVGLDNVKLTWVTNTEKTIERVLIYRSKNGEPMRLYGNSESDSFVDSSVSLEKSYSYTIKLIYTEGGTSSFSNVVKAKF